MVINFMNMKELRHRAGLTADDVARELGVASSTVRNWDAMRTVPRMTPKDMKALMGCYQCTLGELLIAQDELESKS